MEYRGLQAFRDASGLLASVGEHGRFKIGRSILPQKDAIQPQPTLFRIARNRVLQHATA
ncbi:hypothetical protein [Croceicoccus pelagius]|uniref:hypothetical protein n=1 Tax=Croceicoccus pelagius TaxID=1703341 RepID=UPI00156038B0|nr:hypothetical protein [Croceicoccus pelagius]